MMQRECEMATVSPAMRSGGDEAIRLRPAQRSKLRPIARLAVAASWFEKPIVAKVSLLALCIWALAAASDFAQALGAHREGAWITIAVAVVILLAALVSSIAGFAFSALAGSALAYLKLDPVSAVQTMVLCSIATQLYAVWKLRGSIRWSALWPMLLAGAGAAPLGVWLLIHVDGAIYAAGLGAFLMVYGGYVAMRREHRVVRGGAWQDAVAGALGGLAGGLAGLPGSFVAIWCSMRGWDKLRQRAVYQPFILVMQVVTIVCLRWQAPMHVDVVHGLSFVPFALLGAIGGLAVFRLMTNGQFQATVSILLAISGIGLLARAL